MSDMYFENLPSTTTPLTAENLNKLNDIKVSSTQPTTGEKVWFKSGKNLFNAYNFSYYLRNNKESYVINSSNSISVSGDNNTWTRVAITISNLAPSTQYTISSSVSNPSGHSSGFVVLEGSTERNSISTETSFNPKVVFTSNSDGTITINLFSNWSGTALSETVTFSQIQLEQNSDKTTYEAYVKKEIDIKNNNNVYEEFYNENNNLEIYSTHERRMGTWIDGKPLYRKVIDLGNLPNATNKTIATNLTINSSNCVIRKLTGVANYSTGVTLPLPYISSTSSISLGINNANAIEITSTSDRSSATGYVILEYTKATD